SFLSSPTLRVRICPPHPEAEEKLYTVHRSLLKAHTNLLNGVKPRETSLTLGPTTSPAAFEAVLEFLYTHSYALPAEYEAANGHGGKETPSPILAAAMQGAIGVWGKPAAIHDHHSASRNISSYQSELFPDLRNGYSTLAVEAEGQAAASSPSPLPPLSPTFSSHEPVLAEKPALVLKRSTPTSRLAAHLDVYALARLYAVGKLISVSLANIKQEVVASPEILHELVRVVYGTKHKNEELRAFVVGIVQEHWERLKKEKVIEVLLKEGGEFVLDVFSKIRGF
ncbi:hypothetical protein FN846DRAFT_952824, partial [Sphaerosporella brunnea]